RLQSQIEHLQSVLSFIEMQPLLKAHLLKEQSHQALN
ncbi:DNA polymerase III subunit alpha, partial [Vibrio cholerae]